MSLSAPKQGAKSLSSPAEQRANSVLQRIAGIEKPTGVEVGVFIGKMSTALLAGNWNLHLTMVDSWEGDGKSYQDVAGDFHAKLSQEEQESFLMQTILRTAFARKRSRIVRARSEDAAKGLPPDERFDFVFIDADHSYEGCKRDIAAWLHRVKPGGWICGHDYKNKPFDGVEQAVDEFIASSGLKLETGENYTWFACV